MRRNGRMAAALALALVCSAAGCEPGGGPATPDPGATCDSTPCPGDRTIQDAAAETLPLSDARPRTDAPPGEETRGTVCTDPSRLSGRTFRADVLEASHPTDLLNEFFQQSADRFELVMVIHFGDYDPETGTLDGTIGAATAVVGDCDYDCDADADVDADSDTGRGEEINSFSWALEPTPITIRTEGCTFEVMGEFDLDICAATASKVLALKRMTGKGSLHPDGSRLRFDDLAGYLPESEVESLCIGMPGLGTVNFHWFMNAAGICANADSDGNGAADAYNFVGIVEATEDSGRFVDEVTGPVFGVAQCPPDTGKCSGR